MTARRKSSTVKARCYTVLRKSTIDPSKKLSTQGKSKTTTKTAAHLAGRIALGKRKRPTRVYLYRRKKIMTFSIKYREKDGKAKATATLLRTKKVKKKPSSKKKKRSKKIASKAEIDRLQRKLTSLKRSRRSGRS